MQKYRNANAKNAVTAPSWTNEFTIDNIHKDDYNHLNRVITKKIHHNCLQVSDSYKTQVTKVIKKVEIMESKMPTILEGN